MKKLAATAILVATCASAHRLDEYLQATLVSVEKTRMQGEITLTPGVAVYRVVFAALDTNSDGIVSEAEQRAYAERVLNDLSLSVDGRPLTARLLSFRFPGIEEMKDGRGEIQLVFSANLPAGGASRRIGLANRHLSRIAAYQVNALVPRDPGIRIIAQNRNYDQSLYELEFEQEGPSYSRFGWIAAAALLLFGRLGYLFHRRFGANASAAPSAGIVTESNDSL